MEPDPNRRPPLVATPVTILVVGDAIHG
jgi:hypothetical protein